MIRYRDQRRVEEPALGRARQTAAVQQKERVGEGAGSHQVDDVVTGDPDGVLADIGEGSLPSFQYSLRESA